MYINIPVLLILAFGFDWLFDGIDFRSFILGIGSLYISINIHSWSAQLKNRIGK